MKYAYLILAFSLMAVAQSKIPTITNYGSAGNCVRWAASGQVEDAGAACGSGTGTVTHTAGNLTNNYVMLGAGTADSKVDSGCSTDGAGTLTCTAFQGASATDSGIGFPSNTAATPAVSASGGARLIVVGNVLKVSENAGAYTEVAKVSGGLGTPTAIVLTNATGLPAAQVPATPLNATTCATGAHHTMTAPREYFFGTTATDCYIDFPTPAAGYEFCVRTSNNVSAKIHLAALGGSIMYEKVDRTGYGTAGTGTVDNATGAVTNQICLVGVDTTHYAIMSYTGDFANN